VAALTTTKTAAYSLGPSEGKDVSVACDAGQKAIGGGFDSNGVVVPLDTRASGDGASWTVFVQNLHSSQAFSGTAYAICLR
jgi:hypothetical protein